LGILLRVLLPDDNLPAKREDFFGQLRLKLVNVIDIKHVGRLVYRSNDDPGLEYIRKELKVGSIVEIGSAIAFLATDKLLQCYNPIIVNTASGASWVK
jgi:hypothetical protein